MSDTSSGGREPDRTMDVELDELGIVRVTWAHGLNITGQLASDAMTLVDRLNAGTERPLLVDMTGTATLTRSARMIFTRKCSASMVALLGRSPVDRVIANFALGVSPLPVPTRFFTSEPTAVAWLSHGNAPA